jgi:hypothetical protein
MEIISALPSDIAAEEDEAGMPATPSRMTGRPDALTAQKVEVGIILQAMLGTAAAAEYLANNGVDAAVTHRVLHQRHLRRGRHDSNGILC